MHQLAAFIDFKQRHNIIFPAFIQRVPVEQITLDFLNDQSTLRERFISEYLWNVDFINNERLEGNENQVNEVNEVEVFESNEEMEEEMEVEMQVDVDSDEDEESFFNLRSGKRVKLSNEAEAESSNDTELRKGKKVFSKECIQTIVRMTTDCNISVNQARKCFLICENSFNGKAYKLEPDLKPAGVPRSNEEYEQYKNVLPSESTIRSHRHKFALSKYRNYAS